MAGAGDRQELGEALDDAEDERLQDGHLRPPSRRLSAADRATPGWNGHRHLAFNGRLGRPRRSLSLSPAAGPACSGPRQSTTAREPVARPLAARTRLLVFSHYENNVYTAPAPVLSSGGEVSWSASTTVGRSRRRHPLSDISLDRRAARHAVVTVAEVAERFGLHPNVARMHLTKLEQAGLLLDRDCARAKGGGRPARLYSLSDQVSSFDMPPRRYDLLSSLALKALWRRHGSDTDLSAHLPRGRARRRSSLHRRAARAQRAEQEGLRRARAATWASRRACCPRWRWEGDELDVRGAQLRLQGDRRHAARSRLPHASRLLRGARRAVVGEVSDGASSTTPRSAGRHGCRLHFAVR